MANERTILVAGNCQIGGLAAAIQRIHPDRRVVPLPLNPRSLERSNNPERLMHRLTRADFVFGSRFVREYMIENDIPTAHFIAVPGIRFPAFHPDVISARTISSKRRLLGANHSAICLWSYKNGLDPEVAVRLFNKRVFRALGYLDQWDQSVLQLKSVFESEGLEFSKFMSAVKRDGIFMHTPNHPRISALIWLSKLACMKSGADESVWQKEVLINDAFIQIESWPVYPDIASEYALQGSYDWFLDSSHYISGIQNFVDHFYRLYADAGVPADDIQMVNINEPALGTILAAEIGRQS